MGLAHQRLSILARRLVALGATPAVDPDEIDTLDEQQADSLARAEGDRLALLAQLVEEQHRATARRPLPPQQGRLSTD